MHFISLFNFTDLCYFYPTVLYISLTVFKMNKVAKSQLCNVHIVIWCCTMYTRPRGSNSSLYQQVPE